MKENSKCCILMGMYYMILCLISGYAAYYLGARGFSSWEIGVLYSSACVVGALLQGAAGKLADRDPRWFWKNQIALCSLLGIIISVLRLFLKGMVWEAASYALLIVLVLIMMPLANTACFYYSERGGKVDFGIARGVGSISYAALSLVLGKLTAARGEGSLLICCVLLFVMMLLADIIMPKASAPVNAVEESVQTGERRGGAFIKRYPVFMLMAVGITLVMVFHNIVCTYMINIMEEAGGGSDSMGISLAIAAAVELPILFLYSRIKEKSRLSSAALITIGCVFFAIRGGMFIAASGVLMIYFVQLLQSISYGLVTAAKASYANEVVTLEDETTGQSVMSMCDSFGMVAGSLLGGILLSGGGTDRMLLVGTAMAAAGAIVAFIAVRSSGKGDTKDGK